MMAKGTFGQLSLASPDLDGAFERLQASDAEVVQEPIDQPYGVRDRAFRDPAGTTANPIDYAPARWPSSTRQRVQAMPAWSRAEETV
jgi:hypothetical protein